MGTTTETITLDLIRPTVASLVTFGDRPGDTVGEGGIFLTMNASEHAAMGSPTRLVVSVAEAE